MRSFRDLPIRRKLTLAIMLTSGIGLLLAGTLIVAFEWVSYRERMTEDVSTLAKIIGDQSTAALSFNDPKAAQETLETLKGRPEITAAAIYDTGGKMFASYTRNDVSRSALPSGLGTNDSRHPRFISGHLNVMTPVLHEGEVLGTVFLQSGLQRMQAQLTRYVIIVACVVVLLLLVTMALSEGMQRAIANPILDLSRVARAVSEKKDYSVRASGYGQDEIGQLISTFNGMLAQIEGSDAALRNANAALQQEVVERKRAEASLEAYARKLEQRNRELQEFAYVASHDLQEPLRAIQNFSERVRTKYASALNEEALDYLQRMQNAAGRMRILIQDLLAFSRVTTKARPFTPTDLNAIAQSVIADLTVRLEETGGKIELGDLPTCDADATQMRQLLQNLCGNALKFRRPEEASVVKVYPVETDSPDAVAFAVEDNGIGFDEKYAEKIFAPFQRLHSHNKYEGTGIGLAICRKIVERHGGTINVRSAPDQGATFTITLPRSQPTGDSIA